MVLKFVRILQGLLFKKKINMHFFLCFTKNKKGVINLKWERLHDILQIYQFNAALKVLEDEEVVIWFSKLLLSFIPSHIDGKLVINSYT